jgi:hypothetical protein
MATTVGSHSVSAFNTPVNGGPLDANVVRGNDNTVRTAYVAHDADTGIHVQSSTLATRPAAGTAGRKWITADTGSYKLWYDDGTTWHEVATATIDVFVLADENLVKGDVVKVTGYNNGAGAPRVAKVSSAADVAFGIINGTIASGATGYLTNTGIIADVATNAFAVGDILYPNTSGGFTTTKPSSGNYQPVAYVLRSNANNGVLYVEFSAPRIVERSDNTASTVVLRDASGNFAAGTITAGALTSTGLVTFASLKGTGATTVTNILDEDNMASDSATALATQQSIKAYVDAKVATVDTLAEVLANGNTTGTNNIIVSSGQKITTNTIDETTAAAGVTIDSVLLKDDVVNATDIEVDTISANNGTLAVTLGSTGVATIAQQPILSSLTASQAVFTDSSKGLVSNAITGTGNVVMSASPTLTGTIGAASMTLSGTLGVTGTATFTTALADSNLATISTAGKVSNSATTATSANTASAIVARDASGNFTAGTITASLTGSISGNAATATALQTARNINGVSFNGTADITVTAAAGTLSGSTLASGVTASSLTSVGTLTSLTVSGAITGATATNTINGVIINSGAVSGVTTLAASGVGTFGVAGTGTGAVALNNGANGCVLQAETDALRIAVKGSAYNTGNRGSLLAADGGFSGAVTVTGDLTVDTTTLKVDSTNNRVGIGTTSPDTPLHIVNDTATTNAAVDVLTLTQSTTGTAASGLGAGILFRAERPSGGLLLKRGAIYGVAGANADDDGDLAFYTLTDTGASGFTEKMRLDSSGNVGIGVTPSAWEATSSKAIQLNGGSLWSFSTSQLNLLQNAFYNTSGNLVYTNSAAASAYRQISGVHSWYNAASGTAGNTISFTQAMTLDASGNLALGLTSASTRLHVKRADTAGMQEIIRLDTGNDANNDGSYINWVTGDGGTQVARIGGQRAGTDIGNILFETGNGSNGYTERARITSGGTLGVGTTTAGFDGDTGLWLRGNINTAQFSRSGDPTLNLYRLASNGDIAQFHRDSTLVGSISVTTTATAYNTSSDSRLKENIEPAGEAGHIIDAIKIVQYDWKAGGHTRFGVVAQDEVENVPEAINVGDDGEEITAMWGVDYSKLVPMLVKEIQSLRARVAALEA